jgi:hypothetical protein
MIRLSILRSRAQWRGFLRSRAQWRASTSKRVMAGCLALVAAACSDKEDDDALLGPINIDGGIDGGGISTMDASLDSSTLDASLGDGGTSSLTSVFVSSATSTSANLGGLAGADSRCQSLATAVGLGNKTWRAFLSVESDPTNGNLPTSAFNRIGVGPWYNAKGVLVARDVPGLYALNGNPELFLDERGNAINGQWNTATVNEHDILTGTFLDGGVALGKTCADWTSAAPSPSVALVGHSDGLGPSKNSNPPHNSWYSSHENGGCNDTAPRGGAGRIYCFAKN